MFNENSRVKIPALIQLTRLGYGYLSLKDSNVYSQIDPDTNIFCDIFTSSLVKINSTNTPPHANKILGNIHNLSAHLFLSVWHICLALSILHISRKQTSNLQHVRIPQASSTHRELLHHFNLFFDFYLNILNDRYQEGS